MDYNRFSAEMERIENEYEEALDDLASEYSSAINDLEERLAEYRENCSHHWKRPDDLPPSYIGIRGCTKCGISET